MGRKAAIDDNELLVLKNIVDKDPNLYLDDTALQFAIRTRKYLCHSTIWNYLHGKLGYSFRVCQMCNNDEELRFLAMLSGMLQGCPECLIMVDETHKDWNTDTRTSEWKKGRIQMQRTMNGISLVCKYTIMAAFFFQY